MTSNATPQDPEVDPADELSVEVLDEVSGGQEPIINLTFN